ncbi:uncharacterized protein BO88DRAFT_342389 [Aspergillus vadensis CBS 113365]|uniref:Uncharacterized protein n=1 Tax=Aspergillus vadensis (strain CBS 113365 / IMI 142717 / IBT 24658) TaxID=1448311 RepID=A0A319BC36_ASPVC|nr:hypothetical protein BO88DRAFT_342389 [Aspergillus vadensis CBS 113365]PYH68220.1 hypothetical protein BO88DRAFT_342389 [Aspergillus vadensis CBS 113365]
MSIPTDIANLLIGEDAKLSIHFDEIPLCNDGPRSGPRFYMLSTNRALKDHENKEDDLRYLSKGIQGAIRLNQLLNAPPHIIKEKESTAQDEGKAVMRLGETTMVVDETFDAHPIHSHIWNSFMSIEFRFPKADFTSLQYLQTSWKGLECGDTLFTKEGTPTFEEVSIVSGVCLFNARLLEMSTTSPKTGGVDVDLLKNSIPTYNELDYIARASSAIADVAAMNIFRACEQGSGQRLNIKLDIPSWHYFHAVVTKLASKQCSNTEALQWMDAIDQRHDQIGQVFVEAIRDELAQRGIRDSTSYNLGITSRTNTAAVLIRTAIEQEGEIPLLDTILAALNSEEDGCWKRFYEMIPTKERPSNLDQLGYLFYVYEAIRPALVERPTPGPPVSDQTKKVNLSKKALKKRKPRRLIISVDDSAERRIYSRAQRILSKIRQSSELPETYLVESYVCRRFLINGNKGRARLGRLDPLPDIPVRTGSPQETMLPLDVVRQLYGDNSALNLQRWLQEVGLPV